MWGCSALLVVLVTMSSAVDGKALLDEECGLGVQYWCQDLVTAMKCGAVEHCFQSERNVHPLAEENLCTECKLIVTTVGAMVKDGSLQDAVRKVLHTECAMLPVKSLVPSCQLLVDKYLSVIVTLLVSFMKPDTVCGYIGLCKTDRYASAEEEILTNQVWDKLLPPWKQEVFSYPNAQTGVQHGPEVDVPFPLPVCWMCQSFISRLKSKIQKDDISKSALQLCLLLPEKLVGLCQGVMEKYTVIALDLVLSKLGPRLVCGLLFKCVVEESNSPDIPFTLVPTSDLRCETCIAITALLKPSFHKDATEADLEEAMTRACNSHHLDWQECQKFLKHHQMELLAVLGKPWDYKFTCQVIGACTTQNPEHPKAVARAQHTGV